MYGSNLTTTGLNNLKDFLRKVLFGFYKFCINLFIDFFIPGESVSIYFFSV